jgi:hypothetical protein
MRKRHLYTDYKHLSMNARFVDRCLVTRGTFLALITCYSVFERNARFSDISSGILRWRRFTIAEIGAQVNVPRKAPVHNGCVGLCTAKLMYPRLKHLLSRSACLHADLKGG